MRSQQLNNALADHADIQQSEQTNAIPANTGSIQLEQRKSR